MEESESLGTVIWKYSRARSQ